MRSFPETVLCLAVCVLSSPGVCTAQTGSFPAEDPPPPLSSREAQAWMSTQWRLLDESPADIFDPTQELYARRLLKSAPDRAAREWIRAAAYQELERVEEAVAAWRSCAEQFKALGTRPEEAMARGFLGALLNRESRAGWAKELAQALEIGKAEKVRPSAAHRHLYDVGRRLQGWNAEWARKFLVAALDKALEFAPGSWEVLQDTEELAQQDLHTGRITSSIDGFRSARTVAARLRDVLDKLIAETESRLAAARTSGDGSLTQELALELGERRQRRAQFVEADARSLMGLASASRATGDYAAADTFNQEAGAQLAAVPTSLSHVNLLLQRAELRIDRHEFREASKALLEATSVALYADDRNGIIIALALWGRLGIERGDLHNSVKYLRIAEEGMRDPEFRLARIRNAENVARYHFRRGNVDRARERLKWARNYYERWSMPLDVARVRLLEAIHEREWDQDRRRKELEAVRAVVAEVAPQSLMMASIELELGELGRAPEQDRIHFDAAYSNLQRTAPRSLHTVRALRDLAIAAPAPAIAEKSYRLAWDIVRSIATEFASDEAMQVYASRLSRAGADLATMLAKQGRAEEAFAVIEQSRANGLLRLLSGKQSEGDFWDAHRLLLSQRHVAEKDYEEANAAYNTLGRSLDELERKEASSDSIARAREALDKQHDSMADARRRFVGFLAGSEGLWLDRPLELASTLPALPSRWREPLDPGTTVVMFAEGLDDLLVAVIERDGPIEIRSIDLNRTVLGGRCAQREVGPVVFDSMTLSDTAACFNEVLERSRGDEDAEGAKLGAIAAYGRVLFDELFPEPLRRKVLSARRLIISPDGFLWRLPFAALATAGDKADPRYLGSLVPITYTASLETWTASRQQVPSAVKSGAGALVVEGSEGTLKSSEAEARQVSCAFKSTLLTGNDATESRVRAAIESASLVHFATHGRLDPDLPMMSTLQLTRAAGSDDKRTDDDGQLQAWEVFSQLRLQAELVVLSACETGQGDIVLGEGIIGLPRAFQYAGARSVIASLWRVPDEATAELMRAFYRSLIEGQPKDVALHRAMASLQASEEFSHPYNWAAFELYGNAENGNLKSTADPGCDPH